jgi:signal transduction histidine kinase
MSMVNERHQPSDHELENSLALDWLISHLRWLWLISALLFAWLNPAQNLQLPSHVLLTVVLGLVVNLIQVGALYSRHYPAWMPAVGVGFDTLVAIVLLALTGGWQSPMLPAVLFPVLVASARLGLVGGLATAVPIAFAYSVFSLINPSFVDPTLSNWERLYQLGLNVLLLVGVALVNGLVFRQYKISKDHVESTELRALRSANERAKVIYEMASTLSATLNYKRVLKTMLDMGVMGLVEVTGPDTSLVGLILLFEQEGNPERLKVHAGRNIPRSDENRVVAGQNGLVARVIYTAEPAITDQVSNDSVLSQFICMQSARSAIAAPLRAGFDTFGVVVFSSSKRDYFKDDHRELLTTFCNQAVIALKNAQLYEDLQAEQRKILEKESEARHKLARDLHDGPTQTISAVAMRLNFIRMMLKKQQHYDKVEAEVAKVEELVRKTTHEVRTMLFTLRPVVLETQGLAAALEHYAERLRQSEEINMEVDAEGYDGQLAKQAEGVVFSVVEEAVGNAKKHAHASRISVRLSVDDHLFTVEIHDDGVGFDIGEAQRRREVGHLGLLNIEERAELIGGRYSLQSQPGAGTLVRLDIPLRQWGNVE